MKQETLQLTSGNHRGDRRELDFYPTPSECTIALMDYLNLPNHLVIWECAAGDGAIADVIENRYGHKVIRTDIQTGENYLDTYRKADAIITNPPFNLSAEFIQKALIDVEYGGFVAMLLKSQYWHAAKRSELFTQTNPRFVLPLTWRPDFLAHTRTPGGKKAAPTMEVAWTVWQKGYMLDTAYHPLLKPKI